MPSHVTALTHISSLPAPSPSVAVSEGPTSEWNEVLSPPRPCSVAEAEGGESDGRKNAPRAIQEKADIMSWNLRLCYLKRVNRKPNVLHSYQGQDKDITRTIRRELW